MEIIYNLGYKDEKYATTVKFVVESLVPVVQEYYSRFGVSLDKVLYYSDDRDCEISFLTHTVDTFYPKITLIPQPINSLRDNETPNNLLFGAVFTASGISRSTFREMMVFLQESNHSTVETFEENDKTSTMQDKMKSVIEQAQDTVELWESYVVAKDIFVF